MIHHLYLQNVMEFVEFAALIDQSFKSSSKAIRPFAGPCASVVGHWN